MFCEIVYRFPYKWQHYFNVRRKGMTMIWSYNVTGLAIDWIKFWCFFSPKYFILVFLIFNVVKKTVVLVVENYFGNNNIFVVNQKNNISFTSPCSPNCIDLSLKTANLYRTALLFLHFDTQRLSYNTSRTHSSATTHNFKASLFYNILQHRKP